MSQSLFFPALTLAALVMCSIAPGQSAAFAAPSEVASVRSVPPVTVSSTPTSTEATLPPPSEALGDTLSARGRYLLAIKTYEALPPTAQVQNKLGVACEHMLMFDKARTSFEAAIKLDPNYAEAYNNLGTLAHSLGDWKRAEKMYRKSLKLKPDSVSTLKNLGTLLYAEQKFKKGDQAFHRAIALDPQALERGSGRDIPATTKANSAGEMHYHMAMGYAQAGNHPLALQFLRKAIGEGFHDRNRLLHEKEFADLRTQPVFLRMVDDLKKN